MPGKILIVDDEPNLQHTLAYIFNTAGYFITTAENAQKAISALEYGTFNLIILDLKMPDMDGLSLLSFIRLWHPQIPVFILTAYGNFESAIEALRLEARDFLQKPVDPGVLLDRIQQVLQDRPIEMAARQYSIEHETKNPHILQCDVFDVNIKARFVEMHGQPILLPPATYEARSLVRWHKCQIRKEIEEKSGNPHCMIIVRNYGYRLVPQNPSSDEQPTSGG